MPRLIPGFDAYVRSVIDTRRLERKRNTLHDYLIYDERIFEKIKDHFEILGRKRWLIFQMHSDVNPGYIGIRLSMINVTIGCSNIDLALKEY